MKSSEASLEMILDLEVLEVLEGRREQEPIKRELHCNIY
jgi:hypothetical protein